MAPVVRVSFVINQQSPLYVKTVPLNNTLGSIVGSTHAITNFSFKIVLSSQQLVASINHSEHGCANTHSEQFLKSTSFLVPSLPVPPSSIAK